MTMKKYLTTPEEILALKDTDTNIYYGGDGNFVMRFVQGVLCLFSKDNGRLVCFNEPLSPASQNPYILVEEPVKEADANDIGKLCKFLGTFDPPSIGILAGFTDDKRPIKVGGNIYKKCYKLTPSEVAELTGYKVEECK